MFKKVLISNRGEIAVRIERTCREMGIETVAVYERQDQGSLHVRLADECVELDTPNSFTDQETIWRIAKEKGVDAIHPGYGFMAERPDFIQACKAEGITFIGDASFATSALFGKLYALARARAAGFQTVESSTDSFDGDAFEAINEAAQQLGYPVVIKSCIGGRGRAERFVRSPENFPEALRSAQAEAQAVYGSRRVYLEKAILPVHQIGVQIAGDSHGNLVHLGESEGSLQFSTRWLIHESPAPCLDAEQRRRLWLTALDLARLLNYQSVGTVEFLVDAEGQFYFTEIKPRIRAEHPLVEIMSRVDLVREQIRIAAGEPLSFRQTDVQLPGWAMLCCIEANDPSHHFLPSPGQLRHVRFPGGSDVRVDTYVQSGTNVPGQYDPVIAELTVWAKDRAWCLQRLRSALHETALTGTPTNLALLQRLVYTEAFTNGTYTTDPLLHVSDIDGDSEPYLRDLAVTMAVLYLRRNQGSHLSMPERLLTGWHRNSRQLT